MPQDKTKGNSSFLKTTVNVLQIIFFIVIGFSTIYSLRLTSKYNKLIFKPVVGITDIKITRLIVGKDTYENVKGVSLQIIIENVGNLPAKNALIMTRGKLGDTNLPFREPKANEGVTLIQNTKYTNETIIGREVLDKMLTNKDLRLIYRIEISYTDWENYNQYNYPSYFEVLIINKEPLNLVVRLLSEKEASF